MNKELRVLIERDPALEALFLLKTNIVEKSSPKKCTVTSSGEGGLLSCFLCGGSPVERMDKGRRYFVDQVKCFLENFEDPDNEITFEPNKNPCRQCLTDIKEVWGLQEEINRIRKDIQEVIERAKKRDPHQNIIVIKEEDSENDDFGEVIIPENSVVVDPVDVTSLMETASNHNRGIDDTNEDTGVGTFGVIGNEHKDLVTLNKTVLEPNKNKNGAILLGFSESSYVEVQNNPTGIECTEGRSRRKITRKYRRPISRNSSNSKTKNSKKIISEISRASNTSKYESKISSDKDGNWKCGDCDYIIKCGRHAKTSMVKHYRRVHLKERMCECSECDKRFFNKGELRTHMHRVHKIHIPDSDPFRCRACGKSCGRRKCKIVHEFFKCKLAMSEEELKENGLKRVTCSYDGCDFRHFYQSLLQMHIQRVHTKELAFPCSVCGKSFIEKTARDLHAVTHQESRQRTKCDHCDCTFLRMSSKVEHTRRFHTSAGKKQATCETCGASFHSSSYLNQHFRRVHGKKAECQNCGKFFNSERMKEHKKKCTGKGKDDDVPVGEEQIEMDGVVDIPLC